MLPHDCMLHVAAYCSMLHGAWCVAPSPPHEFLAPGPVLIEATMRTRSRPHRHLYLNSSGPHEPMRNNYAQHDMRRATYKTQRAAYNVRHARCRTQCATHDVRRGQTGTTPCDCVTLHALVHERKARAPRPRVISLCGAAVRVLGLRVEFARTQAVVLAVPIPRRLCHTAQRSRRGTLATKRTAEGGGGRGLTASRM
jgi:hypothetical protein